MHIFWGCRQSLTGANEHLQMSCILNLLAAATESLIARRTCKILWQMVRECVSCHTGGCGSSGARKSRPSWWRSALTCPCTSGRRSTPATRCAPFHLCGHNYACSYCQYYTLIPAQRGYVFCGHNGVFHGQSILNGLSRLIHWFVSCMVFSLRCQTSQTDPGKHC